MAMAGKRMSCLVDFEPTSLKSLVILLIVRS